MKVFKELTFDSLIYGASNFLGKVIGFLLLPIYTVHLTPYDYGITAMLAFVPVIFAPLASMGITQAIFRRYNLPSDEVDQSLVLATGSFTVLISSLVLLLIGLLVGDTLTVLLIDDVDLVELLDLTLYTAFASSIGSVFTVVLRAERKVVALGVARILELLITVGISIYLVVYLEKGVFGVVFSGLIGAIFSVIIMVILCWKYLVLRFSMVELGKLLNYGLPFLPHRLLAFGSTFIPQYYIKTFLGLSVSGIYDVALRFALPLTFIVGSVQAAWVPLKYQIHKEQEDADQVFRKVISTYLLFLLIVLLVLAATGPELLRLFTDEKFNDAAGLLPIVLLIPFAQAVYFMMGTGFEFTENTKPMPIISGAGLLVSIVSILGLVDWLGIYAALLGIILCWAVMAILARYFAKQRYYVPLNMKVISFFLVCSLLITLSFYLIQDFELVRQRLLLELAGFLIIGFTVIFYLRRNHDFNSLNLKSIAFLGMFNKFFVWLKRY